MKKILLPSYAILMAVNFVAKILLSYYDWFNFVLSSLVLLHTAGILLSLQTPKIDTRFRVSLSAIFSFFGIIMFLISQFSMHKLIDNLIIIFLIGLCGIQWLIFVVVFFVGYLVKES